ncbi:hypothetical protein K503DRAFT_431263 [Rhizopogon vinicolor AM-OR11-026]|uniref:Winged helix-turn helix domain-containing protein n=1 Tax=Rhizopogon vinicolor AM-OR11-026 TaxID=1314800 RepID=A0A1B7NAK2_9AGAM|nr:hypothetical protein K503DRAFT_431263 [Rhizopogon vinicolor AM-OR11-026]
MRYIRKTFLETGEVVRTPVCAGRPRILDSLDANFLESCIERQPDILLTEMQDQLREIFGVEVSISTIPRTIQRRGFTRKKVTCSAVERDENNLIAYKMLVGEHFRLSCCAHESDCQLFVVLYEYFLGLA